MRLSILIVLALTLSGATGCAAVFEGTSDTIRVESQPPGAAVYADGARAGQTPMLLTLESNRPHFVEVRKDGYETQSRQVTNSVEAGWLIADILFGWIPVIVDAATGAWHDLNPDSLNFVLEPTHRH